MADLGQNKLNKQSLDSMEKYFFAYIMENPKFFHRVEPMSFKNSKIKFIYDKIRDYYLKQDKPIVPSNPKILESIRLQNPDINPITTKY